jgi:cell division protein FtsQ
MGQQADKKKENHFLLGVMKLLLICLLILIPAFVLFVTCRLETVIVEGSSHYTKEEIQQKIITKKTDGNTLLLYLRLKYGKVESIPFVEDIDMELVNKNTIKIQVYEKVITGCIEYMGGYMYFDKDGIVVESSNEKLSGVPFVTGLKFNSIVLYEKLEVQKEQLFNVILNLTQLIQKYELDVETIRFNTDLEVTLKCGDVKVLLGQRETYDEQIAELKDLLPSAIGKKLKIDMVDFKEGQDKIIARPED